jgi:hypothetical protein
MSTMTPVLAGPALDGHRPSDVMGCLLHNSRIARSPLPATARPAAAARACAMLITLQAIACSLPAAEPWAQTHTSGAPDPKMLAETNPSPGASTLHAYGTWSVESFAQRPGPSLFKKTTQFHVQLAPDGRYLLHLGFDAQGHPATIMSFDGTDTYDVHYVPESVLTTNTPQERPTATISAGAYAFAPLYGDDGRGVLWLALASSRYFGTSSNGTMPLPWSFPRVSLMAYGHRYSGRFTSGTLRLPLELQFVRDPSLDLPTPQELDRSELDVPKSQSHYDSLLEDLQHRLAEWPSGFVSATFLASAVTNLNGFEIPTSFQCSVFHPLWNKSPRLVFIGHIESLSLTSGESSFRPAILAANLQVLDRRFRWRNARTFVNGIIYRLPDTNNWRFTNDPELRVVAQATEHKRIRFSGQKARRLTVIYLLIATVILPPLTAGCYITLRRRRKAQAPG